MMTGWENNERWLSRGSLDETIADSQPSAGP